MIPAVEADARARLEAPERATEEEEAEPRVMVTGGREEGEGIVEEEEEEEEAEEEAARVDVMGFLARPRISDSSSSSSPSSLSVLSSSPRASSTPYRVQ